MQHRAADRSFCDDIAHPWSSSSHLSGAADRLDESFLGQDRLPHLPFVLHCLGFTLQLLGLQLFLEKAEFVGYLNLYSMLDWDSTNHTDWNIIIDNVHLLAVVVGKVVYNDRDWQGHDLDERVTRWQNDDVSDQNVVWTWLVCSEPTQKLPWNLYSQGTIYCLYEGFSWNSNTLFVCLHVCLFVRLFVCLSVSWIFVWCCACDVASLLSICCIILVLCLGENALPCRISNTEYNVF